jgi:hypothetical protein
MPTPKQQRRRALELLEASIDGCTEAFMLAYGFKTELLIELVNAEFATSNIERMVNFADGMDPPCSAPASCFRWGAELAGTLRRASLSEKKARKGLRGWPIATIAFYGPNLSQATKVTVGIVPSENAEVEELRDWKVDYGDIRADPGIAREILEFIEKHRVLSVAMTDGVIGCPHQEGVDYEGEWCPVCEFWHGRDRFTGHRVH